MFFFKLFFFYVGGFMHSISVVQVSGVVFKFLTVQRIHRQSNRKTWIRS